MNILGVSSGHDANICVLSEGKILLHIEKERLTRKRYDSGSMEAELPTLLRTIGMEIGDIDIVATSTPVWSHVPRTGVVEGGTYNDEMGYAEGNITLCGRRLPAVLVAHHLGHCAYAFFLSDFEEADILSLDAGGNFTCGLAAYGSSTTIALRQFLDEQTLGELWCALSIRLFGDLFAAGKVMGLASYGKPQYIDDIWKAYGAIAEGGHRVIRLPEFPPLDSVPSFPGLPDIAARGPISQADADAAASLQHITNEMILNYCNYLKTNASRKLCLTGGLALNCVANEVIRNSGIYEDVFVPPAPNDSGLSLGFSFFVWHCLMQKPRQHKVANCSPFLGPNHPNDLIDGIVRKARQLSLDITRHTSEENLARHVAELAASNKVVGVHQGRSESGPRALGHRSILADPRSGDMRDHLNRHVKFRESFRPLAPAVLAEMAAETFGFSGRSPYMSFAPTVPASTATAMPATTHVDGTARLQTVERSSAPKLRGILEQFEQITGLPGMINTSLNSRGSPISETPDDSFAVFTEERIDALVIDEILMVKR